MKIRVAIEILKALKRANGQRISLASLGGSAGCSTRTIGRCLEELICCGCPIDIKKRSAWRHKVGGGISMSDETFVIAVSGNGMKNAGISDGDLIRFRRAERAQDGDIVCARIGRRHTVSRYREVDGELRLCSETDEPNHAPFVRVAPSQLTILGIFQKVIKWI